jgi:arylsulfatase
VLSAEFHKTGDDEATRSAIGTLTLYVDDEPVGGTEIMTQPGHFSLAGEGVGIGRDSGSSVSPEYSPPFPLVGATIDRVVVDVAGLPFVDHEKEVLAYLARD